MVRRTPPSPVEGGRKLPEVVVLDPRGPVADYIEASLRPAGRDIDQVGGGGRPRLGAGTVRVAAEHQDDNRRLPTLGGVDGAGPDPAVTRGKRRELIGDRPER